MAAGKNKITLTDSYLYQCGKNTDPAVQGIPEGNGFNIDFDFDYVRLPKDMWDIHIDLIFVSPAYSVSVRNSFRLKSLLNNLFSIQNMIPVIKQSLKNTTDIVIAEVKKMNQEKESGSFTFDQEFVKSLSEEIIEIFNEDFLEKEKGQKIITGRDFMFPNNESNYFMVIITIFVMDTIFYDSSLFDIYNTKKVLGSELSVAAYRTLKRNCLNIAEEHLQMNPKEVRTLQFCIEIALQLLLGNHSQKIEKSLKEKEIGEEEIKKYITYCHKAIEGIKPDLIKLNLVDPDKKYYWNELMK